ncbi:MAG: hypothetical protein AAF602_01065 [Myxococcota bacterium]
MLIADRRGFAWVPDAGRREAKRALPVLSPIRNFAGLSGLLLMAAAATYGAEVVPWMLEAVGSADAGTLGVVSATAAMVGTWLALGGALLQHARRAHRFRADPDPTHLAPLLRSYRDGLLLAVVALLALAGNAVAITVLPTGFAP